MFQLTPESLICSNTSNISSAGQAIQHLNYSDLNCFYPCGPCICHYNMYFRETNVNCANMNLQDFPPIEIEQKSFYLTIHMENNLFKYFPSFSSKDVGNLTELYLSHNKLEKISSRMLLPTLKVLYLDDNQVQWISKDELSVLDKLIQTNNLSLKIGNNPFICGCENQFLYQFVLSKQNNILGNF